MKGSTGNEVNPLLCIASVYEYQNGRNLLRLATLPIFKLTFFVSCMLLSTDFPKKCKSRFLFENFEWLVGLPTSTALGLENEIN